MHTRLEEEHLFPSAKSLADTGVISVKSDCMFSVHLLL